MLWNRESGSVQLLISVHNLLPAKLYHWIIKLLVPTTNLNIFNGTKQYIMLKDNYLIVNRFAQTTLSLPFIIQTVKQFFISLLVLMVVICQFLGISRIFLKRENTQIPGALYLGEQRDRGEFTKLFCGCCCFFWVLEVFSLLLSSERQTSFGPGQQLQAP